MVADLHNEGLALLKLAEPTEPRAAWTVMCHAVDRADADKLLEMLGLTPLQAKRGQRIAAGYV